MKVTEIKPRTFHIDFEEREELLKTFIRFQEYYESPEFKGKVFTVDEYAKWYVKAYKKDSFTYYTDWSGCNVPSHVFDDFRSGKMNPLSEREQKLLSVLPNDGETYYVIGSYQGGREDVLSHEVCHSLYFNSKEYKDEVDKLLSEYDTKEVEDHVLELGYHKDVLMDEVQAYISASHKYLDEKNIKFSRSLSVQLQKLKERF